MTKWIFPFENLDCHLPGGFVRPSNLTCQTNHSRAPASILLNDTTWGARAEPLGAHSDSTTCRPITPKTHFHPKQRTQCIITSCHVYNPTLKCYKGSHTLSLCIGHRTPCTFSSSCPSSTTLLLELYISIRGSHQTSIITLIDPSIPLRSSLTN